MHASARVSIFVAHCTKWIHNVVDVAINTKLIRFQNCLNFLLQLCHGNVKKTFPYFQSLHGQSNTVLQPTGFTANGRGIPDGISTYKIHPIYIKKASNFLVYHSH
jgi:hypothetical protein